MYFEYAFASINKYQSRELIYSFTKLFHLFFFYPGDQRVFNIFYLFPWFLLLGFSLHGIIKTFSWNKYKSIYLFIVYSCLIGIIFFVLPRYQTMMKIALIPFAAYSINSLIEASKRKLRKDSC